MALPSEAPFFPADALAPVARALADLADASRAAQPGPCAVSHPPSPRAPVPHSAAAAPDHVAHLLAAVLAGHPSAASIPVDPLAPPAPRVSPRTLHNELALVHAFGVFAESALPAKLRLSIATPLVHAIAHAVHAFAINQHVGAAMPAVKSVNGGGSDNIEFTRPPLAAPLRSILFGTLRSTPSTTFENNAHAQRDQKQDANSAYGQNSGATCHVWPTRSDARRHILRSALSARYGSAAAAPTAAVIAGPPLILFVRENPSVLPCLLPASAAPSSMSSSPSLAALREWRDLSAGTCVFQIVDVDEVSSLRAEVASAMKIAVKTRGLSPTLVVVNADPETVACLSTGAATLRALCDAYGTRLHVEGPALAILASRPEVLASLQFHVNAVVPAAHSVLLDVASWFGVTNAAVVTFVSNPTDVIDVGADNTKAVMNEGDEGAVGDDLSLARVMALWWLCMRVDLNSVQAAISAAAEQSVYIVDEVSRAAHLLDHRSIGCGARVLLSFSSGEADAAGCASANRAILRMLLCESGERPSTARLFDLTIVRHEDRDWISFSPLSIGFAGGLPVRCADTCALVRDLIAAARRCEVVNAGASAFVAAVKQCAELEVVSMHDFVMAPLYFGAVRVVPLALASRNGLWRSDDDMVEQVDKLTCALAASLTESNPSDLPFEGVLHDDEDSSCAVPFICVGPLVTLAADASSLDSGESWSVADFRGVGASSNIAIDAARSLAGTAAEYVAGGATNVISGLQMIASASRGSIGCGAELGVSNGSIVFDRGVVPDSTRGVSEIDGALTSSFVDVNVCYAGATSQRNGEDEQEACDVTDNVKNRALPCGKRELGEKERDNNEEGDELETHNHAGERDVYGVRITEVTNRNVTTSIVGIWERLFGKVGEADNEDRAPFNEGDEDAGGDADYFRP
jgi:hypothetical protein